MSPFDPFALTTFCDDIRYEVGGKYSLIGIYRDDIVFQSDLHPTFRARPWLLEPNCSIPSALL